MSGGGSPSNLFFVFKIVLVILGLFHLHVNFRVSMSNCMKKSEKIFWDFDLACVGCVIELERIDIVMLSPLAHEHGIFFCWLSVYCSLQQCFRFQCRNLGYLLSPSSLKYLIFNAVVNGIFFKWLFLYQYRCQLKKIDLASYSHTKLIYSGYFFMDSIGFSM